MFHDDLRLIFEFRFDVLLKGFWLLCPQILQNYMERFGRLECVKNQRNTCRDCCRYEGDQNADAVLGYLLFHILSLPVLPSCQV